MLYQYVLNVQFAGLSLFWYIIHVIYLDHKYNAIPACHYTCSYALKLLHISHLCCFIYFFNNLRNYEYEI